jgi:hypothetical protein
MKQKNLLFILSLAFFPLFAFTCVEKVEGGHEYIEFVNNSSDTVYVVFKESMHIEPSDTLLSHLREICILEPGMSRKYEPGLHCRYWETTITGYPFIQFFILSKESKILSNSEECDFHVYIDENCIREYMDKYLLKRCLLIKEDLDRMNWVVTYPPEE